MQQFEVNVQPRFRISQSPHLVWTLRKRILDRVKHLKALLARAKLRVDLLTAFIDVSRNHFDIFSGITINLQRQKDIQQR